MKRLKEIDGNILRTLHQKDKHGLGDTSFTREMQIYSHQGKVSFHWWDRRDAIKDLDALINELNRLYDAIEGEED